MLLASNPRQFYTAGVASGGRLYFWVHESCAVKVGGLDRHIGTTGLANIPSSADYQRRLGMQANNRAQQTESASVCLENRMHFVGDIDGIRVDNDADEGSGAGWNLPQLGGSG